MQLIDDIPLGIALLDPQGRITHANRPLRDWFHLLPDDSAGENIVDACVACGDRCSELCREIREHAASKPGVPLLRRVLISSGLILDVRCTPMPGQPGFLLAVEDVTARHEQDRLLQILSHTLERLPDMVGVAGPGNRHVWANPAAEKMLAMLGLPAPGTAGADHIEALQPSIGGVDLQAALAAAAKAPAEFADTPLFRAGETEPCAWMSQIVMAHHDEVTGTTYHSTICRDVTAKRQSERALHKANARLEELLAERSRELTYNREFLRSLIETNRDQVLSVDAQGVVTFTNAGFVGKSAGALIGRRLDMLVDDVARADFSRQCDEVLAGRAEHVLIEVPGGDLLREHWCLFSIGAVRCGSESTGLTVIISDLTALNDVRQRLRGSEKLIATGRMAARIAHEINNPLTGISGAMQLIKADLPDASPAAHYAGLVEREIARISNIVRQMYGLYRPEHEPTRTMDLQPLLDEVVTLMDVDARRRNVRLQSTLRAQEMVMVQEQNLRQILMNIIRNALEVTPAGGAVDVSVERHGRCVDVVVTDQGPGISAELRQQMFEPFFTTKSSSAGMGLGLGLSISDTLAKAMGGSIVFENSPGGGACCKICLPEAGTQASLP